MDLRYYQRDVCARFERFRQSARRPVGMLPAAVKEKIVKEITAEPGGQAA